MFKPLRAWQALCSFLTQTSGLSSCCDKEERELDKTMGLCISLAGYIDDSLVSSVKVWYTSPSASGRASDFKSFCEPMTESSADREERGVSSMKLFKKSAL